MKLKQALISDPIVIMIVVLALLAQTPTTAYLFNKISNYIKPEFGVFNWVLAASYVVVAECCILIWTIKGKKKLSWGYCIVTILLNLAQLFSALTMNIYIFLGGCLISLVLPVSIALLSDEFAKGLQINEIPRNITLDKDTDVLIFTKKAYKEGEEKEISK